MLVVISTFTVPPRKQRELLNLLHANAEEVLRHQPGFVTADLLATPDGTTVAQPVVQQFTASSSHRPAK